MARGRLFTEKEINIMKKTDLSNTEVARLTNRSRDVICKVRSRYLTEDQNRSMRNNKNCLKAENNNKRKPYTIQDIKEIVNSSMNSTELAVMYGRSSGAIRQVRLDYKYLKEVER